MLTIVRCPTTFAAGTPPTTAPLPTSTAVNVPADETANLVVYGDDAGIMMLVGPSGWTCHGSYGADGSGGLVISPVGESVPSDPDVGWHPSPPSSDEAIVGYETGGSPVEGAESGVSPVHVGGGGREAGSRSTVRRAASSHERSSTKTGSSDVAFEDPEGVAGDGIPSGGQDPANGVMLYVPKQT